MQSEKHMPMSSHNCNKLLLQKFLWYDSLQDSNLPDTFHETLAEANTKSFIYILIASINSWITHHTVNIYAGYIG